MRTKRINCKISETLRKPRAQTTTKAFTSHRPSPRPRSSCRPRIRRPRRSPPYATIRIRAHRGYPRVAEPLPSIQVTQEPKAPLHRASRRSTFAAAAVVFAAWVTWAATRQRWRFVEVDVAGAAVVVASVDSWAVVASVPISRANSCSRLSCRDYWLRSLHLRVCIAVHLVGLGIANRVRWSVVLEKVEIVCG